MSTLIETMTAKRSPPRTTRPNASAESIPTGPAAETTPYPCDHPEWIEADRRCNAIGAEKAALERRIDEANARLDKYRTHLDRTAAARALALGVKYSRDPLPDLEALQDDHRITCEALEIAGRNREAARRKVSGIVGLERREEFRALTRKSYEHLFSFFKAQGEEQRFLRELQDRGVDVDSSGLRFRPLWANGMAITPDHLHEHHRQLAIGNDSPLKGSPHEEFQDPATTPPDPHLDHM